MDAEGKAEGKRIQESVSTDLVLDIHNGFTIDERDLTQPSKGPGYYMVNVWINGEDAQRTTAVKSFGGVHQFKERLAIGLDSSAYKYVYIELARGICTKDPGTSNGTVVMGRAKIRLPPWNSGNMFTSKVNLIGLKSDRSVVVKGYLHLSMQLHRYLA
ncbi:Uncharacterized protein Rs2_15505 [Raphanus sativus]|uniref:Uncharacterized protein LOC108850439 n=1 Tax=Raphanus sativus TaxID=3726 RepID=A0A6J0N493_RAPSA|nr:uncharacterized protein LOC108850439 [Raphanus sativus]KAJ4901554.1 Uncharacterized protein Rs2_15505 [Raphanus sativus]